jgi:Ni,Fe-hydrogenase I small subunit
MLRTSNPTVTEFVLDLLSWEYHELIMAGAGKQAEAALERVVQEHKGEYIAVVEGAIPTADGGVYCTIGGKTALEIANAFAPIRRLTSRSAPARGMEAWFDRTRIRRAPWGCRRPSPA